MTTTEKRILSLLSLKFHKNNLLYRDVYTLSYKKSNWSISTSELHNSHNYTEG